MAQFYTSAVTGYGVTVRGLCTYTESDVSTTNNTSKLTVGLKAYAPDGWRSIRYAKMTVTANGSVISTQTLSSAIEEGWDGTVIFTDKALTVTHNNNGEATINISVEIGFGTTSVNSTGSANFSLTTIARASTLTTVSAITINSTSGSASITKIVSKGNFYHKVQYSFNNSSWNNWADKVHVDSTTSDDYLTLERTKILAGYPTVASSILYLRVYTYSDSAETTQVGSVQTASVSVSIDTSVIKPKVTVSTAIAVDSSPISGYLVAGHSSAKAGFTTTNSSGATDVTTYYSIPSGFVGTLVTTSRKGAGAVTVKTNALPNNGSANTKVRIQAYAVDSRGAVSDTVHTTDLTVYPYNPPKITAGFFRCVSTSNKTADEAGKAATGTFSSALGANASVNSKNSIASTTCKYSKNGGTATNFTSGGTVAIAESDVVVFTVTVTDKVTSSTAIFTVPAALFPIDLYQSGSNMGVGLGTVATSGYLDVGLATRFDKLTYFSKGNFALTPVKFGETQASGNTVGWWKIATGSHTTYGNLYVAWIVKDNYHKDKWGILTLEIRFEAAGKATLWGLHWRIRSGFGENDFAVVTSDNIWTLYGYRNQAYGATSLTEIEKHNINGAHWNVITYYDYSFYGTDSPGGTRSSDDSIVSDATNATNATNATKTTVSLDNPTDSTFRYLTFASGNNGNLGLYASNAGIHVRKGTTSQDGWEILQLGTGIARGTAGNKQGRIRLYGNSTGYMELRADNITTSKYSYFPNHSGTVALEPVQLYANSTGTTGTVTLSETSANFRYLDIYYYSVPSASTSTIRYGYTRVYAPNGKTVTLANTVYWSNYLEITNRTIVISGTSITNASNEQAQFRFTNGSSPSRSSTSSLIYIIRVDGIR